MNSHALIHRLAQAYSHRSVPLLVLFRPGMSSSLALTCQRVSNSACQTALTRQQCQTTHSIVRTQTHVHPHNCVCTLNSIHYPLHTNTSIHTDACAYTCTHTCTHPNNPTCCRPPSRQVCQTAFLLPYYSQQHRLPPSQETHACTNVSTLRAQSTLTPTTSSAPMHTLLHL